MNKRYRTIHWEWFNYELETQILTIPAISPKINLTSQFQIKGENIFFLTYY